MSILLWILVLAITAVGVVLVMPHDIVLRIRTLPSPALTVSVQPFSGRLPPFALVDTGRRRTAKAKVRSRPKPRKGQRNQRGPGIRFVREIPGLVAGLVSAFHIIGLRIDLAFGLGDPAETGQLYGALAPLAYGFSGKSGVDISLRPDFSEVVLSGEIDARLRVRIVAWIFPLVRFVWRSRVWQR